MSNKKYKIYSIDGNIFDHIESLILSNNGSSIIVPHVCNNINLFGAGFAASLANKYPVVKENFHLLGNKSKLGYVQYIKVLENKEYEHQLFFANMIAQNGVINHNNKRPLNYAALVKCMIDVKNFIQQIENKYDTSVEIHAPKFGSGLSGGRWDLILSLIEDIWDNQKVFIYHYKPTKILSH